MFFEHLYDEDLAQGSYLIGCQACGEAIVIDPHRDIGVFLDAAQANGLRISAVSETHIHADYLSGARELATATGASLYLSDEGSEDWRYGFDHLPLRDGSIIEIGNVKLTALHTPGHTPEHLSFLVTDRALTDQPGYLLSGDFVFVGDVGRPDLLDEAAGYVDSRFEGAARLFASLRSSFLPLPDHVQVWPGHGAGSACGKALGAVASTTVGYEKLTAWWAGYLERDDQQGFIDELLSGQPAAPTYFGRMKRWNRDGAPLLGDRPPLPELDPATLLGRINRDLILVDARTLSEQRAGSVPGSLTVPGGGSFATYASAVIDPEAERRPIVLLTSDRQRANALRGRLSRVGIDRVDGFITHLGELPVRPAELLSPTEVEGSPGTSFLDVRTSAEYEEGAAPGAKHVPISQVLKRLDEIPRGGRLVVYCQAGGRAAVVASALRARGFGNIIELQGAEDFWRN